MLASGIPEEAYQALFDLDWSRARGGMIMWDGASGRWFDPSRPDRRR